MLNEEQIADVWNTFREYIDKKQLEAVAERFVDLLADYGTSDEVFEAVLGTDSDLDAAISYYLEIDDNDNDDYEEDY